MVNDQERKSSLFTPRRLPPQSDIVQRDGVSLSLSVSLPLPPSSSLSLRPSPRCPAICSRPRLLGDFGYLSCRVAATNKCAMMPLAAFLAILMFSVLGRQYEPHDGSARIPGKQELFPKMTARDCGAWRHFVYSTMREVWDAVYNLVAAAR